MACALCRLTQRFASEPLERVWYMPSAFSVEIEAEGECSPERRQQRLDEVGPEDRGANLNRTVVWEVRYESEAFFALLYPRGPQSGAFRAAEGDAPLQLPSRSGGRFRRPRRGDEGSVFGEGEGQLALRGGKSFEAPERVEVDGGDRGQDADFRRGYAAQVLYVPCVGRSHLEDEDFGARLGRKHREGESYLVVEVSDGRRDLRPGVP